eukprot:INCI15990.1.p1 GENE.INCI15990.1~~INCI15990.1.p1  ORF type:complete len:150 (+),score=22.10 INCI15990.1:903-1352(+)
MPSVRCNNAFVGLSFCKRVYTSSEWVAAIASAVASISRGVTPAPLESQANNCSSGQYQDQLLVEVMVHPGYPAATWDDFNASPEREKELQVMCSVNAETIVDAVRGTGVSTAEVSICALEQALHKNVKWLAGGPLLSLDDSADKEVWPN